jgi:hypothetical protein
MIDALCVTLIGVPCTFMQTRAHAAGRSRAVRVYVQKCPAGGPLPVHCTAGDRSGEGSLLGRVACGGRRGFHLHDHSIVHQEEAGGRHRHHLPCPAALQWLARRVRSPRSFLHLALLPPLSRLLLHSSLPPNWP